MSINDIRVGFILTDKSDLKRIEFFDLSLSPQRDCVIIMF